MQLLLNCNLVLNPADCGFDLRLAMFCCFRMDDELANIHGQHEEERKRLVQALCDGELHFLY